MTDPDSPALGEEPIEHVREYIRALARAIIDTELEARDVMAVRSSAITKIGRHLNRKDVKAEAPALTPEEEQEVERDISTLDTYFAAKGIPRRLSKMPTRQRLEAWMNLRKLDRGKRGTGAKELRPGIGAAAFVLLDWRRQQGLPIKATLEAVVGRGKPLPDDAVPWTFVNDDDEEVERVYRPSKAVRWLAEELCLIFPTLGGQSPKGRREDWHVAYDWTQRWRDSRGLTKASRRSNLTAAQKRQWRREQGLED